MATITIPAGGVSVKSTDTRPAFRTGGASLTSGQCVYEDATDSNELKATDVTASASATVTGVLLQSTADGEGAVVLGNGCVVSGPTFTEGTWYVCDNSGAISEFSDLASGEYVSYLGYGNDAGDLVISIQVTGETK